MEETPTPSELNQQEMCDAYVLGQFEELRKAHEARDMVKLLGIVEECLHCFSFLPQEVTAPYKDFFVSMAVLVRLRRAEELFGFSVQDRVNCKGYLEEMRAVLAEAMQYPFVPLPESLDTEFPGLLTPHVIAKIQSLRTRVENSLRKSVP